MAALFALWVLVSAAAAALIASFAPHLLYLPVLATVLSYGALGTVGGIGIGVLAAAVVLSLLNLAGWGLVSWIQACLAASRQADYRKIEIGLSGQTESPRSAKPNPYLISSPSSLAPDQDLPASRAANPNRSNQG